MQQQFLGHPLEIQRQSYFREISVAVDMSGLIRVKAGKLISEQKVLHYLKTNEKWLQKVLSENAQVRSCHPAKRFVNGETFDYLGYPLPLEKSCRRKQRRLVFEIQPDRLKCWSPLETEYTRQQYQRALLKCFEAAGRKWLAHRVELWSQRMGLHPNKVSFRSQKTRWGSCSSQGNISLNWRLVASPMPVMDYVVIHELAHLRHQDHSQKFWNLVASYDENYHYNRSWLRENQWAFDFLARKSELHSQTVAEILPF